MMANAAISFDGAKISYEQFGSGNPTLVFVHGFACDATMWAEQIKYFSEGYRVVALDLAGHGRSGEGDRQWSMTDHARDLSLICEELNLNDLILIGHSMGGAVIIEAARILPKKPRCLIGVDTLVYPHYSEMSDDDVSAFLAPFEDDFAQTIRGMVPGLFAKAADPDLVKRVVATMEAMPISAALPTLRALLKWDYVDPLLKSSTRYVCILSGGMIGESSLEEYEQHFLITTIPDVGHFSMMEAPELLNAALEKAISDC